MKVIPSIDLMNGNVVRLVRGDPANKVVYSDNPIETARKWEAAGADMLHVVDLNATLRTGINNNEIVFKIIDSVKIPVQVAGGIRSINAINEMINKNAAKVVLGTIAYKEPDSIRQIAKKKLEKLVISIDQNDGRVMIDGWRETSSYGIIDAINLFMAMGIREFLLTSIDRDGTLNGPDVMTLSLASSFANSLIIASGGISSLEDIIRVRSAGCYSVILGKAVYEGKISIERIKTIA
ncbi:MAG TPA: 1-(5-phosphoribosyl)-5-[(5-phosphoribosylamino)methylideneamino]imidazole-4-carboxamide isomerase [Nitrososphaeraceae archaeon]|jgi:phosphoribosylformimino-5-aminoimidazole carboxamide ribotide isomerase|nr:1-(5-phosphoribosyl)-5-[(5-phosphoribosylamino)methylideneamino]imidazole-4-carboxamide isomerase [Nitrososphaeraceae archaeon]